jgi:hypothetical protein
MAAEVPFGPGTVKIGAAGSELDMSCEVTGGAVTHEYTTTTTKRKLCGTPARDLRRRKDGVKFDIENDLSAEGLYALLITLGEDPQAVPISYTPNDDHGAAWAGQVVPLLPSEVGAGEYGAPLASSVQWPAVGLLDFTPGTVPA